MKNDILKHLVVLSMVLVLVGCGGSDDSDKDLGDSDKKTPVSLDKKKTKADSSLVLKSSSPSTEISDIVIVKDYSIGLNKAQNIAVIYDKKGLVAEASLNDSGIDKIIIDDYELDYNSNQEVNKVLDSSKNTIYPVQDENSGDYEADIDDGDNTLQDENSGDYEADTDDGDMITPTYEDNTQISNTPDLACSVITASSMCAEYNFTYPDDVNLFNKSSKCPNKVSKCPRDSKYVGTCDLGPAAKVTGGKGKVQSKLYLYKTGFTASGAENTCNSLEGATWKVELATSRSLNVSRKYELPLNKAADVLGWIEDALGYESRKYLPLPVRTVMNSGEIVVKGMNLALEVLDDTQSIEVQTDKPIAKAEVAIASEAIKHYANNELDELDDFTPISNAAKVWYDSAKFKVVKLPKTTIEPIVVECISGDTDAKSCDIDNGLGFINRTCTDSKWSTYSACKLSHCDTGYTQRDGACIENAVTECTSGDTDADSCYIANGVGLKSRTCSNSLWSSYGSCKVKSCSSGYVLEGNSCVVEAECKTGEIETKSCYISNALATRTKTCASGKWSSYGSCSVKSCLPGYRLSGNSCVVQSGKFDISILNSRGIEIESSTDIITGVVATDTYKKSGAYYLKIKASNYAETGDYKLSFYLKDLPSSNITVTNNRSLNSSTNRSLNNSTCSKTTSEPSSSLSTSFNDVQSLNLNCNDVSSYTNMKSYDDAYYFCTTACSAISAIAIPTWESTCNTLQNYKRLDSSGTLYCGACGDSEISGSEVDQADCIQDAESVTMNYSSSTSTKAEINGQIDKAGDIDIFKIYVPGRMDRLNIKLVK